MNRNSKKKTKPKIDKPRKTTYAELSNCKLYGNVWKIKDGKKSDK